MAHELASLSRNDAVGRALAPLPGPLPWERVHRIGFGLEEPFGVGDGRRVEDAKAGSPLRSAPALQRVELNRYG